ncbi:hypothetical protein NDU88_004449 [Pleurodeles waltl]|uniref:Uncharacterized protein n=1 Tax=Pleurodeles waltl TaxID=8319 RepID=A0AAV7MTY2_PLEWA|nr:hypothetical protein NDU88_004449 [Pleurodeles waltl]
MLRAALEVLRVREAAAQITFRVNSGRASTGTRGATKGGSLSGGSEEHSLIYTVRDWQGIGGVGGTACSKEVILQLNGTEVYPALMVDSSGGAIVAEKEGGKAGYKNGIGCVAYSLQSAERVRRRAEVEDFETLHKQTTVRNKEEQISNNNKRKLTLSSLGAVNNRKVRVTPSVKTYFRVLPGSPKMLTGDERVRNTDEALPLASSEGGAFDILGDNVDTEQCSSPKVCWRSKG